MWGHEDAFRALVKMERFAKSLIRGSKITQALNPSAPERPPPPNTEQVFEEEDDPSRRSFFSEIISSIADIKVT